MTENTPAPSPEAPKKKRRLFDAFRTDPKKVSDGVWLPEMENGDRLRVRKLWCPEHARAFIQARADYDAQHEHVKDAEGKVVMLASDTPEGRLHVDAVAMASGLIVDWQLRDEPDRPYDKAAMAAVLGDPEMRELRAWISVHTDLRAHFRPDDVAGN